MDRNDVAKNGFRRKRFPFSLDFVEANSKRIHSLVFCFNANCFNRMLCINDVCVSFSKSISIYIYMLNVKCSPIRTIKQTLVYK